MVKGGFMVSSLFDECSWDSRQLYKKVGIEKMTKEILNLLEITSSEESYNPEMFIMGLDMAKWITFYDEEDNIISENEIIKCRKYFNEIKFYDIIEKYLYNSYLRIKEVTLNIFTTFCGDGNCLIEENSIYFIRAFENEYYNNNPYLACCCLLDIKMLNRDSYFNLLKKLISNNTIINIITYCFLVNISNDPRSLINNAYEKFFNKIGKLPIEKCISIYQQFIINLQNKLKLKDWNSEMYIKVMKYLIKNYDDMFLWNIENKYEDIYGIIKNEY
jgi:hypothetical protein